MISSTDILHAKILIVDDRESNILLLDSILRDAGYVSIASTNDSNEVCDLHSKHHYDLILLDIEMPRMNFSGFQVMERLKEIEAGGLLPVIAITAHPDHKLQALGLGARDFISKPFELTELLARVYNMLEARLTLMESRRYINALEEQLQKTAEGGDFVRRHHGGLNGALVGRPASKRRSRHA